MLAQSIGMALHITPLTTVALRSVEKERSGLASGVNNATARVSGLLAVAVLGLVVHGAFSENMDAHLEGIDLPAGVRTDLEAAEADLGAARPPEDVDVWTAARIERAIDESFVAGFRAVMAVCCGLALASALSASLLVDGRRAGRRRERPPSPLRLGQAQETPSGA